MTFVGSLPVIWLVIILAAIFSEAFTEKLVAVWFAPAAAISLVLGIFDISPYIQAATFLVAGISMIILCVIIKTLIKHHKKNKNISGRIE